MLRILLNLTKPLLILAGVMAYFLGAGIAGYLGAILAADKIILGLAWLVAIQLSAHLLYEYFSRNGERWLLLAAFAALTVTASLSVLISAQTRSDILVYWIMGIGLFIGIFYSAPPLSLQGSGYGELLLAVCIGFFVPTWAFVLQTGDLQRLLPMTTFPLVLIFLAAIIVFQIASYANDQRQSKMNLVQRLGWQRAMNLHNVLLLSAYLLYGLASFWGLPRFIMLAALLSLPVAGLEVWQMMHVARGGRPNWRAFKINAAATFALLSYLMAYSYLVN